MKYDRLFSTFDTHTGGNPTRTILSGMPEMIGNTVAEKMQYMKLHYDHYRRFLMNEPRGHEVMSGVVMVDPCNDEADFGAIYIETGGYLPMCGHDTIGFCTALIELGYVEKNEPITKINIDTPAGLVKTETKIQDGEVQEVSFTNVPSFYLKTVNVNHEVLGEFSVDISYGGNFYGIIDADRLNIELAPENSKYIVEKAIEVRNEINKTYNVQHPEKPFIQGLTHIEFSSKKVVNKDANYKNTVVVPPGGIDRSPCGTGTSAKIATLVYKGELEKGNVFLHESIIGSVFKGTVLANTNVNGYEYVDINISGRAWPMGRHDFYYNQKTTEDNYLFIPPLN